jgi:hypothetical protein
MPDVLREAVIKRLFVDKSVPRDEVRKDTTEVGLSEEELNLYGLPEWQVYGFAMSQEGVEGDYEKMIKSWRGLAEMPEVEDAVEEIVGESVILDEETECVTPKFVTDDADVSDAEKDMVMEEWERVKKLLDLNHRLDDLFKQGYIDGALYIECVFKKDALQEGVIKVNLLAPHHVRILYDTQGRRRFVYLPKPDLRANAFLRTTPVNLNQYIMDDNTITFVPMGYWSLDKTTPLSYLQRSIRISNQLKMMEDAMVIYRMVRAPERRAFYVDVGKMPKAQAEAYIKRLASRYRNRKIYNPTTGEIEAQVASYAAIEDFWLPRREGRNTEIQTLEGGQQLGEINDVEYFLKKLYKTLKVPSSRLDPSTVFAGNKSTDITREEIRFFKFIVKLRRKFNHIFFDLLEKCLVTTGKMTQADWNRVKQFLVFDWQSDNKFAEMVQQEVWRERLTTLGQADAFVGKYFSLAWAHRTILQHTDDEISQMRDEIDDEKEAGLIADEAGAGMGMGGGFGGPPLPPMGGGADQPPPDAGADQPPGAEELDRLGGFESTPRPPKGG